MNDGEFFNFSLAMLGMAAFLVFLLSFQGVRDHLFDPSPYATEGDSGLMVY